MIINETAKINKLVKRKTVVEAKSLDSQFSLFLHNTRLFGCQIQTRHLLTEYLCALHYIPYHVLGASITYSFIFKIMHENAGNIMESLINTRLKGYISCQFAHFSTEGDTEKS